MISLIHRIKLKGGCSMSNNVKKYLIISSVMIGLLLSSIIFGVFPYAHMRWWSETTGTKTYNIYELDVWIGIGVGSVIFLPSAISILSAYAKKKEDLKTLAIYNAVISIVVSIIIMVGTIVEIGNDRDFMYGFTLTGMIFYILIFVSFFYGLFYSGYSIYFYYVETKKDSPKKIDYNRESTNDNNLVDKLIELNNLKEKGIITEEEFEKIKKETIDKF